MHAPPKAPGKVPGTDHLRRSLDVFYGALANAPDAARRVGWESEVAHALRLATLVEALAPLKHVRSLLDAGCGEGRLLSQLRAAGFTGHYRGEDLMPHHVARACEMLAGDPAAIVEVADVFGEGPSAEVVVCAGTLNTRVDARQIVRTPEDPGHEAFVIAAVDALLGRADDALVVSVAIADRHPPGVGIGRVRAGVLLDHLRARRPVVSMFEDGVPGEAVFVASRTRRREVARRLGSGAARAELLLLAGDPAGALDALGRDGSEVQAPLAAPEALLEGRALAALGRLAAAEERLAQVAEGEDATARGAALLALAEVRWRLGKKDDALRHLETAARDSDEGRAHLAQALVGLGRRADAARVVGAIEDAWMRRELEALLGGRA